MKKYFFILVYFPILLFGNTKYWEIELLTILTDSPLSSHQKNSNIIVEFPTPEGELLQFEMFETPVMPPNLAKRFPYIKTYSGRGILNPNNKVSVTLNGRDVKILILSNKRNIYIDKLLLAKMLILVSVGC